MSEKKDFIDYYQILQVHQDAEFEIIKSAYRRLAHMHHPDLQSEQTAAGKMQQINEAYSVIGNCRQRRQYHPLWLKQQKKQADRKKTDEFTSQTENPADLARHALDAYFRFLLNHDWQHAYALLTRFDQRMVSLADFCEWKIAVTALYQMGSYVIKPFRFYGRCTINHVEYASMHVFTVFLTDQDTRTKAVNEETYTKHVVLEQSEWRICLGYKDLKPIIHKLKYLINQAPVMDINRVYADVLLKYDKLTGLFSRKGLAERLDQETARMKRHPGDCCLAVLSLEAIGCLAGVSQSDYLNMCLSQLASQLRTILRNTDVAGRLSESQLIIMLLDTNMTAADKAINRFINNIQPADDLAYIVRGSLTDCSADSTETLLLQAQHDAAEAVSRQIGLAFSGHVPLDSQQV